MIEITELIRKDENEYEKLVSTSEEAMLYHSIKWRTVLEETVGGEPMYIVALRKGKMVGALPSFMKRNEKYGNILNSLPFFGSHGGPIVDHKLDEQQKRQVKKALLERFLQLARENDCITSTLITSPFETDLSIYEKTLHPDCIIPRIAQMTFFPKQITNVVRTNVHNEILFGMFEQRCRRAIRKALKNNIKIEFSENLDNFDIFYEMHKTNMMEKRGIAKPIEFFKSIFRVFEHNRDFKLLFARKDDQIIAGLLLFYYKNMIEYFIPCFKKEYASLQATGLLINRAMIAAIKNGYKIWNFGGGAYISGVYMFKRGFGSSDYKYRYYVNYYRDIDFMKELSVKTILNEYQWFYVLPFSELQK